MKEFKNDELGYRFTIPERLTVRQQLAYKGLIYGALSNKGDIYIRYWEGAKSLIKEWECEAVPDCKTLDLDTQSGAAIADIVFWVGNQVHAYVATLDEIPKNS